MRLACHSTLFPVNNGGLPRTLQRTGHEPVSLRSWIMGSMQNILPVLCFLAGFGLAWLIWRGRISSREAALNARLEAERTASTEKIALLEETRQKLTGQFAELSANALARNNQAFLEL